MSGRRVIPYAEARRRKAHNPRSRWPSIAPDLAGEVWPHFEPSFRISSGDAVFTIGSCFARNIEEHLAALGCRIPMLDLSLPTTEWSGGRNDAMNRFHPPAFRQCLAWTAAIFDRDGVVDWADCEAIAFPCGEGLYFDMDMGSTAPVSRRRFLERRQHVYDVFSQAFRASCLMMTPGLIEAWRDRVTGLYLHEAPAQKAMLAERDRWELEILSYDACLSELLAAIDLVRARNPDVKVLITTSPVPMSATFSGEDVRIANSYSKAVLRAACGAVTTLRPSVDYFPSYESVTLSHPDGVWREDRVHVSQAFIGKIVARMLAGYVEGVSPGALQFQRARTLLSAGEGEAAEAAARDALSADPDQIEARIVLAYALMKQNRLDGAEAELRPWLETHPDRPDLLFALSRILSRSRERRAEAMSLAVQGASQPTAALSHFRSVASLLRSGAQPDSAEWIARRAVQLFPHHVEAQQLLSDLLIDQGRRTEAIAVLREIATLRRTTAEDHLKLAELLAETGDVEAARESLRLALARAPEHPGATALLRALEVRTGS